MGLRFKTLELAEVRIPFRVRYRHALADRREAGTLIPIVTTECGATGYGEAIPRGYLTGETLETAREDILQRFWPAAQALEIESYSDLLPAMAPIWQEADKARRTAAYAGLELALIDAAGRAFGQPARTLIPEPLRPTTPIAPPRYTGPIGGSSLKGIRRYSRFFRFARYHDIKLKLGFEDDEARLQTAREAIGPTCDLRVDANAGWTLERALTLAESLKEAGVSSVEQPFPADDLEAAVRFREETGMKIMADESLCTQADAERLIEAGACDLFNVRLAKCGGYSGCIALLKKARGAGLACQLGVLVGETSILGGAEQEFLAGTGPLQHHETAFPKFFLKGDPAWGASGILFAGKAGWRQTKPGFGITVTSRRLARITTQRWRP
ncbi:MAG: enolase C-terminal domain-like protein [Planctomycetota bacterium]|jgi:muconate cycloisomerase